MTLPRYPTYRDSRVRWLGDVPDHWRVLPIRFTAKLESGHTPSRARPDYWQDCKVPWFTLSDVWQIRELNARYVYETKEKISEVGMANSAARLLPRGTVMLSRTASVGFSAIMGVPMATTQDFANWVCGPRVKPEFLLYALKSMSGEFERLKMGSTHNTIYMPDIQSLRFCLPPLPEQTRIVEFLDVETAKTDTLVTEQQRLIELLSEKRQAVILHAVTKGLDPRAAMKPSGIEWLGEVPTHWDVVALGKVTLSRCDGPFGSGLKSAHYTESGVRVVRLQNIRLDGFDASGAAFVDIDYFTEELAGHDVKAGDLLIAGLGDDNNIVGRACVAPAGIEPAMVKADCFRFRLDAQRVMPEFVALALSASAAADAGVLSTGSTRSRIPLNAMATRKLAIPPLDEQRAIVEFLSGTVLRLSTLAVEARKVVDLLRERSAGLISAAVTGQIDVRDRVAAALAGTVHG